MTEAKSIEGLMELADAYAVAALKGDGSQAAGDALSASRAAIRSYAEALVKPLDVDALHRDIMNLPARRYKRGNPIGFSPAYLEGHRDARHAAAELVLKAKP
jgi:hypothetical protein